MQQLAVDALRRSWDCVAEGFAPVGEGGGRQCFRVQSNLGDLFVKVQWAPNGVDDDILSGLAIQSFLSESGIRTSEILIGRDGLGYAEVDGYCVTVEKWAEQEDLRLGPSAWEELGSLCGRLHVLRFPPEFERFVSRLDPLRTLDEARARIAEHSGAIPAELRGKLREYQLQAESLDYLEGLPRAIVHSDITWGNVVRNRGELVLIDLEGAGVAPAVMDLVEVTTKLCEGPSGSGLPNEEASYSFYGGYGTQRTLTVAEIASFPDAHLFHQIYFLADSLQRGDVDYIRRMDARLRSWRNGAFEILAEAASR